MMSFNTPHIDEVNKREAPVHFVHLRGVKTRLAENSLRSEVFSLQRLLCMGSHSLKSSMEARITTLTLKKVSVAPSTPIQVSAVTKTSI